MGERAGSGRFTLSDFTGYFPITHRVQLACQSPVPGSNVEKARSRALRDLEQVSVSRVAVSPHELAQSYLDNKIIKEVTAAVRFSTVPRLAQEIERLLERREALFQSRCSALPMQDERQTISKQSPLMNASGKLDYSAIETLLNTEAEENHRDAGNNTALHHVFSRLQKTSPLRRKEVEQQTVTCLALLLTSNPDVYIQNCNGNTCLHLAVQCNSVLSVRLLLRHDSKRKCSVARLVPLVEVRNRRGQRGSDLVLVSGSEVARVLHNWHQIEPWLKHSSET